VKKKSVIKTVKDQDLNLEEIKIQDSPPQVKQLSAETMDIIN